MVVLYYHLDTLGIVRIIIVIVVGAIPIAVTGCVARLEVVNIGGCSLGGGVVLCGRRLEWKLLLLLLLVLIIVLLLLLLLLLILLVLGSLFFETSTIGLQLLLLLASELGLSGFFILLVHKYLLVHDLFSLDLVLLLDFLVGIDQLLPEVVADDPVDG